jgi:hypothetical protein
MSGRVSPFVSPRLRRCFCELLHFGKQRARARKGVRMTLARSVAMKALLGDQPLPLGA